MLLHFRDQPGMQSRERLKQLVKQFMPDYDKKIDIDLYLPNYRDAVRRATRLWKDACEAGEFWTRNPVTNFHELTEFIRGLD